MATESATTLTPTMTATAQPTATTPSRLTHLSGTTLTATEPATTPTTTMTATASPTLVRTSAAPTASTLMQCLLTMTKTESAILWTQTTPMVQDTCLKRIQTSDGATSCPDSHHCSLQSH